MPRSLASFKGRSAFGVLVMGYFVPLYPLYWCHAVANEASRARGARRVSPWLALVCLFLTVAAFLDGWFSLLQYWGSLGLLLVLSIALAALLGRTTAAVRAVLPAGPGGTIAVSLQVFLGVVLLLFWMPIGMAIVQGDINRVKAAAQVSSEPWAPA